MLQCVGNILASWGHFHCSVNIFDPVPTFPSQAQRSGRISKRLAEKAALQGEEKKEDDGEQEAAASPVACDPSLTEVQAFSTPASNLYTACMYHSILIHTRAVYTPCTKSLYRHYRFTIPFKSIYTSTHVFILYGKLIHSRGQLWVSMFTFIFICSIAVSQMFC